MQTIGEYNFQSIYSDTYSKNLWGVLLTEYEFYEQIGPHLKPQYFVDNILNKLAIAGQMFYKKYNTWPSVLNDTVYEAIKNSNLFTNQLEEDSVKTLLNQILGHYKLVTNGEIPYSGEIYKTEAWDFIKKQEAINLNLEFKVAIDNGTIFKDGNYFNQYQIKIANINELGSQNDDGIIFGIESVRTALSEEQKAQIPTGIKAIDMATGGGLGKSETGVLLAPSGVGKTTTLSYIANHAYQGGANVLQLFFEDKYPQILKKHISKFTNVSMNEFKNVDKNKQFETIQDLEVKIQGMLSDKLNKMMIKKLPIKGTSVKTIENFIDRVQKKYGIKFDVVIVDYLDKISPDNYHRDKNEAQIEIMTDLMDLADRKNFACWTAAQSNRDGFNEDFIKAGNMGGSITRIQFANVVVGLNRSEAQKVNKTANMSIIKVREGADGYQYENFPFDNSSMIIEATTDYLVTAQSTSNAAQNKPQKQYFVPPSQNYQQPIQQQVIQQNTIKPEIDQETANMVNNAFGGL